MGKKPKYDHSQTTKLSTSMIINESKSKNDPFDFSKYSSKAHPIISQFEDPDLYNF